MADAKAFGQAASWAVQVMECHCHTTGGTNADGGDNITKNKERNVLRLKGLGFVERCIALLCGVFDLLILSLSTYFGQGHLVLPTNDPANLTFLIVFVLVGIWLIVQCVRMGVFIEGSGLVIKSWIRNREIPAEKIFFVQVRRYAGTMNLYDIGGTSIWIRFLHISWKSSRGVKGMDIPLSLGSTRSVELAASEVSRRLSVDLLDEGGF